MSIERPTRARGAVHAPLVFAGCSLRFAWLFSGPNPGTFTTAIYAYYATALYAVATCGRPSARLSTSVAAVAFALVGVSRARVTLNPGDVTAVAA